MLTLVFEKEGSPLFKRILDQQRVIIGRDPNVDIQLLSPEISRQHCILEAEDKTFRLKDLSRNGTLVNSKPVEEALLKAADEIQIGPWKLKFLQTETAPEETHIQKKIKKINSEALGEMLGTSKKIRSVFQLIRKAAESDVTVCLIGESGTGKELAARQVHQLSERRAKPFVAINCGAIPENLIESLLFGHEKGAFTGAVERNTGVFEQACGGSLFLDEIGEMPMELQSRLLRVLEERTIRRVGARQDISVNIRLITATNKNLQEEVSQGRFRQDLFYRLYIFPILLPPLKDRAEDIEGLARHFLKLFALNGEEKTYAPGALQKLINHSWGGNVRELKNVIQRTLLLARGKIIEAKDLELTRIMDPSLRENLNLENHEKSALEEAMRKTKGNYSKACAMLGIARTTLMAKLKRFGMLGFDWK